MLIGGIALGLILGLLVGGTLTNLASIRLHRLPLLMVAVIVRFGTEFLLNSNVPLAETLRVPLLGDVVRAPPRRPVGQSRLPGHEPRVRRRPGQRRRHPGQRRLHADLGAQPPARRPPPRRRDVVAPHDHPGRARRLLPAPSRPVRRRHPDPLPDHPERGVDRRRLPDARARLLPVRGRRPRPAGAGRGGARSDPGATRRAGRLRPPATGRRSGRRDRPVPCPHRRGRPGAAAGPGQRRTGHGLAVAVDVRSRRGDPRLGHGRHPAAVRRGGRTRPAAPVRPARAQRLVLGPVGRPAHLAVRRPAQPDRARRGRG